MVLVVVVLSLEAEAATATAIVTAPKTATVGVITPAAAAVAGAAPAGAAVCAKTECEPTIIKDAIKAVESRNFIASLSEKLAYAGRQFNTATLNNRLEALSNAGAPERFAYFHPGMSLSPRIGR